MINIIYSPAHSPARSKTKRTVLGNFKLSSLRLNLWTMSPLFDFSDKKPQKKSFFYFIIFLCYYFKPGRELTSPHFALPEPLFLRSHWGKLATTPPGTFRETRYLALCLWPSVELGLLNQKTLWLCSLTLFPSLAHTFSSHVHKVFLPSGASPLAGPAAPGLVTGVVFPPQE